MDFTDSLLKIPLDGSRAQISLFSTHQQLIIITQQNRTITRTTVTTETSLSHSPATAPDQSCLKKMTSRAASAATSRRAKQEIVRLLFGAKYSRKGPEAHRKLDPFQYSYTDLRTAYLERLHSIHPDKAAHESAEDASQPTSSKKDDLHRQFVTLQEAWDQYEEVIRMMKNVTGGDKEESNFTMFGVGCSFSDSDEEKRLRAEITDQACRGWFSGGAIAEVAVSSQSETKASDATMSLLDDDWFISTEEESEQRGDERIRDQSERAPRRSLVQPHFRQRA